MVSIGPVAVILEAWLSCRCISLASLQPQHHFAIRHALAAQRGFRNVNMYLKPVVLASFFYCFAVIFHESNETHTSWINSLLFLVSPSSFSAPHLWVHASPCTLFVLPSLFALPFDGPHWTCYAPDHISLVLPSQHCIWREGLHAILDEACHCHLHEHFMSMLMIYEIRAIRVAFITDIWWSRSVVYSFLTTSLV